MSGQDVHHQDPAAERIALAQVAPREGFVHDERAGLVVDVFLLEHASRAQTDAKRPEVGRADDADLRHREIAGAGGGAP